MKKKIVQGGICKSGQHLGWLMQKLLQDKETENKVEENDSNKNQTLVDYEFLRAFTTTPTHHLLLFVVLFDRY